MQKKETWQRRLVLMGRLQPTELRRDSQLTWCLGGESVERLCCADGVLSFFSYVKSMSCVKFGDGLAFALRTTCGAETDPLEVSARRELRNRNKWGFRCDF